MKLRMFSEYEFISKIEYICPSTMFLVQHYLPGIH